MKENTFGNIETEQLIKMAEDFLQKQSFETDHPLRVACADFYNKDLEKVELLDMLAIMPHIAVEIGKRIRKLEQSDG